ncbi:MAG: hypothetical protein KDE27_15095, partial [Planctomycetes bacterium]|nr:hypothetical protein [Planctomycetota bacterium]
MPRLRASQRSHPATVAAALLALTAATAQQPVLAGRVATPAGEPAAGAAVTLRWRIAPELPGLAGISLGDAGLAELVVQSDERGSFRIGLPHHGPFEIAAGLGDQRSAPQFPVMAGAFVELSLAEPVTVGGQVFDAAEQPVAGVDVRLVPEVTTWGRLAAYRVPEPRGGAVTDADGRFAIPFQDTYLRRRQVEPFVVFDFAVDGVACSTNDLLR